MLFVSISHFLHRSLRRLFLLLDKPAAIETRERSELKVIGLMLIGRGRVVNTYMGNPNSVV